MQSTDNMQLEDWHEYAVTSRREIVSLLRKICEKKSRILVGCRDRPLSWVVGIDCDANRLIIDLPSGREQCDSLRGAGDLAFETTLDAIRILFDARQVREVEYRGGSAFAIDIPSALIRLQRREFFRVSTPVVDPVLVCIAVVKERGRESVTFALSDISCGGIGLLDHELTLGATVGRTYTQCQIGLPDIGVITTGLQLRSVVTTELMNDKTIRRLGCQFVAISRTHLAMVQRYVTRREHDSHRATA